jgi:hypothetical protein
MKINNLLVVWEGKLFSDQYLLTICNIINLFGIYEEISIVPKKSVFFNKNKFDE